MKFLRLVDTDFDAPCALVQVDMLAVHDGTQPGMVVVYDDEPDTYVAVPADFDRFVSA